jgi:hypothetical protein
MIREITGQQAQESLIFHRLFSYLLASGYNQLMTFELEERDREEALLQSGKYIENIIAKL